MLSETQCLLIKHFMHAFIFLLSKPSLLCFPLVLGLSVQSEMDLRCSSSSALSSSLPNLPHQACHLLQTSLKPSLTSLCTPPSHLPDPSGSSQPSRPTHYAFTVPAFTRAHPPALPKIFQPTAGSGTHTHAVIKNTTKGCCLLKIMCAVC